jgi:tyrosine-protein phosphatase SIW14
MLPNFHKVSEDLYRGAQPDRAGFEELEKMGVKTVVNLRSFHTDRWFIRGLDLHYYHLWLKAWHPEAEDISQFFKIYTLAKIKGELPIFIHCMSGKDRTGAMVALFRVRIMGWSKEDAIKEMMDDKFGSHVVWGESMSEFVNSLK